MVRIKPKKYNDGRGKDKKTAYPRRSRGRRRKYYGRSTARPAGNAKNSGGAAGRKTPFSGTLGLPRLGNDARGGKGQKKAENTVNKKSNDREDVLRYVVPRPK